ncbi:unnamed protein product [Trifolium pratense]|uniref:Uncharacterized protein n=1 Tax=Trifolium pratense TaxID=57577 RepID=A0ACB0LMN7_TRIPR|nr:unnamed protein product [Trifolium pratense]
MDANSSLFRLVHLQNLDLSDNDFNYSQIPSKIGELSNSIFSGEVPPQVSQLSKLLCLDLGSNPKTSPKVREVNPLKLKLSSLKSIIQNSTKLEILLLSYVTISSTLPDTLTNLTSLKAISLYNSELYGEFPIGVFHLPNLELLNLRYNPNLNSRLPEDTGLYGTLPVSIRKLSSLLILSIRNRHFFGYIPSLGNLTQLMSISLQNNKFRDDPSASLANITKLSHLVIGSNEFTIETISWIGKLSSLIAFDISSVNTKGEIPLSFSNLTQLEVIDASNSNIKGEIPSWIINITNLAVLNLRSNFFHGNLELETFLKLKNLVVLDLSVNKLSLIVGKSTSNVLILECAC